MDSKIILTGIELNDLFKSIREIVREELSNTLPQETSKDKKLSRKDVKNDFGICYQTLNSRMKDGTLPYHRIGRKIYFLESELTSALPKIQLRRKK